MAKLKNQPNQGYCAIWKSKTKYNSPQSSDENGEEIWIFHTKSGRLYFYTHIDTPHNSSKQMYISINTQIISNTNS